MNYNTKEKGGADGAGFGVRRVEKVVKSTNFLAKTKDFLEFYKAFCWGCQEFQKSSKPTLKKKRPKVASWAFFGKER